MTLDEQKEYIRNNYKKLTGQFMAKMLGIRPERVYALVKEMGLKKQEPPVPTSKPKDDMSVNPLGFIPKEIHRNEIPLRIDHRTTILIPRGVDPVIRRKEFIQKTGLKVKL